MPPGKPRSMLFQFREYPPEATPGSLADYLDRYREITTLGVADFDLTGIPLGVIELLEKLTRRYDVQALKRFDPEARTAMLVCFLVEAHKSLLDQLIAMRNDEGDIARPQRQQFGKRC